METYTIMKFLSKLLGELRTHIIVGMPDGSHSWASTVDLNADGRVRAPFLAHGSAQKATFYDGETEVEAWRLLKSGTVHDVFDHAAANPKVDFLSRAFLLKDVAAEAGLYIWEGQTVIYNSRGKVWYQLIGDDPRSKSVKWPSLGSF